MACLNVLKVEIRSLENAFPRTHPRLQVVSASVDELTCRFIDPSGRKHTIHANITVSHHHPEKDAMLKRVKIFEKYPRPNFLEAAVSCSSIAHQCTLKHNDVFPYYLMNLS